MRSTNAVVMFLILILSAGMVAGVLGCSHEPGHVQTPPPPAAATPAPQAPAPTPVIPATPSLRLDGTVTGPGLVQNLIFTLKTAEPDTLTEGLLGFMVASAWRQRPGTNVIPVWIVGMGYEWPDNPSELTACMRGIQAPDPRTDKAAERQIGAALRQEYTKHAVNHRLVACVFFPNR